MLEDMSDGFYSIAVGEFQIPELINSKFQIPDSKTWSGTPLRLRTGLGHQGQPPANRGNAMSEANNLEFGIWN